MAEFLRGWMVDLRRLMPVQGKFTSLSMQLLDFKREGRVYEAAFGLGGRS